MKNLFEQLKRREELKKHLNSVRETLHTYQTSIDGINEELDLINEGKLVASEEYIGTLLQRKLKIQQHIVGEVETMVLIERELKGLF